MKKSDDVSRETIGSLCAAVLTLLSISAAHAQSIPAADDQGSPLHKKTYSFSANMGGSFTITQVSPTVVRDNQALSFTSALPFPLTAGVVQGFDNLTIPTFPARFFDGTFYWTGRGEDAVFGIVTVQTSVFTDPVNEYFTGTFQFTGGGGRYLNATGGGVYAAHSLYQMGTEPGQLYTGSTTISGTGSVTVERKTRPYYKFMTLDVPGAIDTFLYALNNNGTVVGRGSAEDGVSSVGAQFVDGQFHPFAVPGAIYTELDSVNDRGDLAGSYEDGQTKRIAFTSFQGKRSDFTAEAGAVLTIPWGLNNQRIVAGTFTNDPNYQAFQGFIRANGIVTPFDFPGSDVVATQAFKINDVGQVAGGYQDPTGSHGYVTTGNNSATVDYPGAELTQAFGINNSGDVAGYFQLVPSSPPTGFVSRKGEFVTVEVPGAVSTFPQAINDLGELAGFYLDSDGRFHGFTATPRGGNDSP